MWSPISYCIITLAVGTVLSLTPYTYHSNFGYPSGDEPFLTLRNIPVQTCVTECQLRNACMAVNYWRQRRDCEMLLTDEGQLVRQNVSKQLCTFIRKSDVQPLPSIPLKCQSCDDKTVCDIDSGDCVFEECRQLLVPNATIKGNILSVGSKIRIYCNSSFAQRPNETLSICQENGTWSNAPTCHYLYACAEPPTIANAEVDMGTRAVGDVRYYTCDAGFVDPQTNLPVLGNDSSKSSIQCHDNGTWTISEFQCVSDCNDPPDVANADVDNGNTLQGTERHYKCDSGYSEVNNAQMTVTCQQSGLWTDVAFSCVKDCNEPPNVEDATVTSGAIVQGSERSYTCNAGYIEINNAPMTVTCQQGGSWTKAQFDCVQACAEPPPVANAAVVTIGTRVVGDVIHYNCNEGFIAIGTAAIDKSIQCKGDGTWTAVEFRCIADTVCPPDPLAFHYAVLQDGTVVQFRAFFDASIDFIGAHAKCEAEGGSLYQILTLAKMNFTLQLMTCPAYQSTDFWVNGVFNQTTSVWETTAGTPLPMNFWNPGMPDNDGATHSCIWITSIYGYKWDDRRCDFAASYPTYALCELY